jgi:demethylmenaquinone methyltransferase/2-methoxy-6-polyprenyl-1,4-benzoquinol methylase
MESRRRYRAIYDHVLSRVYDLYMGWYMLPYGGEPRFRRGMLEGLEFRSGERVLDCTCGTGNATAALRRRLDAGVLVGSDLSRGQLRRARRKRALSAVPLLQADATHLPFPPAAFDSVFLPHAIHEMPRAVRGAALREALRVCGSEGRVVVLELDRPESLWLRLLIGAWFFFWVPGFINFETPTRRDLQRRGVVNEVREAGFTHVRRLSKFAGTMQAVEGRP